MPNYNSTGVSGEAYTRCKSLVVINEKGATPVVQFNEETYYDIPGHEMGVPSGNFSVAYEPTKTILLIDPNSGHSLGTSVTQEYLQLILYSLYIQCAHERDAGV